MIPYYEFILLYSFIFGSLIQIMAHIIKVHLLSDQVIDFWC